MKYIAFVLLIALASCTESTEKKNDDPEVELSKEIIMLDFKKLIDSANVEGSILIANNDIFYSNDFDWARTGHLPASTFKIPNSIIALELGIMKDDSSMIYWDGKQRFMKSWEQDLHFRDAFHLSCVPCYQEIARSIGVERMKKFTRDFQFGKMDFDSTTIDEFWLQGTSNINQFEEIDFLQRFRNKELPISDRTYEIMSRMMIIDETDDYVLRGKTGWSVQDDINNCWFVGYLEIDNEVYYFATNIQPSSDAEISEIVALRKEITRKAFSYLDIEVDGMK